MANGTAPDAGPEAPAFPCCRDPQQQAKAKSVWAPAGEENEVGIPVFVCEAVAAKGWAKKQKMLVVIG